MFRLISYFSGFLIRFLVGFYCRTFCDRTARPECVPIDTTLNTFIRSHAKLTGTKFMCLEGGCGACIVTLSGRHPVSGDERSWAVNSVSHSPSRKTLLHPSLIYFVIFPFDLTFDRSVCGWCTHVTAYE